ncbi:hypothetical protein BDV29DRAFT_156181 [Aspergillus leporis]|uniref:Uncharacterized protein n=1 Tax=Aspergillus leporis TaxID=41062 RepID=A0A5N5X5X6_9EURO|nr:hypothetical protein BDV29DRAFT_156181 [Aspergillus leporis]
MASTYVAHQEMIYDKYLDQFHELVKHATFALSACSFADFTTPSFTFDEGVGLPLFFTALKCRDRTLRQEALALLQRSPQIRGLFKSRPWAALAELIIQVEEGLVQGARTKLAYLATVGHKAQSPDNSASITDFTPEGPSICLNGSPVDGKDTSTEVPIHKGCQQSTLEDHHVHDFGAFQATPQTAEFSNPTMPRTGKMSLFGF